MLLLLTIAVRAGTVSLEIRPAVSRVDVGTTVSVGLYAVSDTETNQAFSALDTLPTWVPEVLELLGNLNNGPYGWLLTWFPSDAQLDGVNDTWLDGTAYYQAVGRFPPIPLPQATPDGLLVTTWRFQANQGGTSAIYLAPMIGTYSSTRVHDPVEPGVFLTGSLRGATVIVVACGEPADLDQDCDVDLLDTESFNVCLDGPDLEGIPACLFRDLNEDDHIDLGDFAALQRAFTGSVGQ